MKIRRIHIAAFGKLADFTLEFSDGFNVLYGVNESGKSTLMYFIRVMFYGFNGNARKANLADNDRERFRPWHSPLYGGSILFEQGGKDLLLERNFGAAKAKDTSKLVVDATGKEIMLSSPDEPGLYLFGMGKSEFLNTVFVRQMGTAVGEDDSIKSKLVSLAAGSEMQVSADRMKSSLLEYRKKIFSDRKNSQSEMGALQESIFRLEDELRQSYDQENRRQKLADEIHAYRDRIHRLKAAGDHADTKLEAAGRMKEMDKCREVLKLWDESESVSSQIERMNKSDESGRAIPSSEEILAAEKRIEMIENAGGRIGILNKQAESIRRELEGFPLPDESSRTLSVILQKELEMRQIEADLAAAKEEADAEMARFEQTDRELERLINQAQLDQRTMVSSYEGKFNEIAAARSEAVYQKSAEEQRHRLDMDACRRRNEELERKISENQRHLADSERQLDQESGILAGQRNQLKWQQEQLDQMKRKHAGTDPGKDAADKKRVPVLGIAGGAAFAAGLAGLFLHQQVWPLVSFLGGLVLFIIQIAVRFSGSKNKAADSSAGVFAQIQGQEFQIATLIQQIDAQTQKINNLSRDIDEDHGKIMQYGREIAEYRAMLTDSEGDSAFVRQIAVLENVINEADLTLGNLKISYAEELEKAASKLNDLKEQKARHQYRLSDELMEKNRLLAGRTADWHVSIKTLGADSKEKLQTVKEIILQQKAAYEAKENALASTLEMVREEELICHENTDCLNRIADGYFRAENVTAAKLQVAGVKELSARIGEMSGKLKYLHDRIGAAAEGKTREEAAERLAANQTWISSHYPDARRLTEGEEEEIRREKTEIQQELQSYSQTLGQLSAELRLLENAGRLPIEIEREKAEHECRFAICQSKLKSVDLAIQMVSETDDEMRQTFGPIINLKTAEYLSGLTGEDIQPLRVGNDFQVQVEDPVTRQYKAHDFFSGGKVDQIYLALRLAITDAVYSREGADNMPFAFDDILVQYDQQRGRQAVDFLMEKSEKQQRQMIFITCHDHIREYCRGKGCHLNELKGSSHVPYYSV